MEKPKILSGDTLVAKGITKSDASLPEVGLKDVIPNGSWLEQKQLQAALEARKNLIEVERIEKCGTLSHAEWRDDIMLAEVTHRSGGHWQYLGHNVGKTLYLRPEEALFLIEVNCLLLKHNDVKVSLEKAYSLLLPSSIAMIHYRVYASLSRIGYKVFRHKYSKEKNKNESSRQKNTVYKSEEADTPMCATIVSDAENFGLPVESENNASFVVEYNQQTQNYSENVDSSITNTKTCMNVDPPIESQDTVVGESNLKLEEDIEEYRETNQHIPEICETDVDGVISDIIHTLNYVAKKQHEEPNEDIAEICVKDINGENTENNNTSKNVTKESNGVRNKNITDISENDMNRENRENNITKGKESPTVMDVDETDESKRIIQNVETYTVPHIIVEKINTVDDVTDKDDVYNSDICTESMEAADLGIVLMEQDHDNIETIETAITVEVNNMVKDVGIDSDVILMEEVGGDTCDGCEISTAKEVKSVTHAAAVDPGTQNIDGISKDFPNNNERSNSNKSTATKDLIQESFTGQNNHFSFSYLSKIEKLTHRQLKPSDSKSIHKHFEDIPDLYKKQLVTLNVPKEQFIPKNIFVNNSTYLLDLQNIKKRSIRSASTESATYTSSDEVSGTNVRRLRSRSGTEFPPNPNFLPHVRFPRHLYFRPYGYWRPQSNLNYYQFNMFFQRPFPNMFFQTRSQYPPRLNSFVRSFSNPNNINPNTLNIGDNARKRTRSGRTAHLQYIKNLAVRLKQIVLSGNTELQNFESLQSLIHSYNMRYKSRLRLTEGFDVINEEKIVETIELDDEEESRSKKRKLDQDENDKFDENLYRLRQLALKLKNLEDKDKATASHRRAFSKAIKTFNKSYHADVYLNDVTYEVIDRRYITLQSSSDSDCVVEEPPKTHKTKGKRLRNPFNILKRRSERLASQTNPSSSVDENLLDKSKTDTGQLEHENDNNYNALLLKTFNKDWLPNDQDFGRAEVLPKQFMNVRLVDSNKEEYLYDFMKDQFQMFQNWLEAKICFLRHLEETNIAFQNEQARILADSDLSNVGLRPLIDTDDCSDMASVLEKLRIIKHNKNIDPESILSIHFDVYNRDVPNFRKRNPPKPHFRVICIEASSGFPQAAQVMGLHSKYEDNVAIVFAIVSMGAISYLQINPIELPIYVPSNDVA